jgi:hypothetical protein
LACHLQIDEDLDPAYDFGADPDSAHHFDADPDPTFQFDADPDPQYWVQVTFLCSMEPVLAWIF